MFKRAKSKEADRGSIKSQVTLSLISHTNVGKTTLARTLLGRDVGEVKDEAHVTDISEAHLMLETAGEQLLLWDTPGFGDSARLLKRLQSAEKPLLHFLQSTWDRFRDRPLWCSQQALANVKEEADLVFYLVNAGQLPTEAPYIEMELQILQWMDKPVVVLLNQTGKASEESYQKDLSLWKSALEGFSCVREVQHMDAFARCWVQEDYLMQSLAPHLEGDKKSSMERLAKAWKEQNSQRFTQSSELLADLLVESSLDRREVEQGSWIQQIGFDRAVLDREMKAARVDLSKVLAERFASCTDQLISLHQLEGNSAAAIADLAVDSFGMPEKISEPIWTAVGGAAAGVTAGVAADVLSGGLTLGGGAIVGGLTGGAGAWLLAKGFNLSKGGDNGMRWSEGHYHEQWRRALLSYLAVAHFGRGRGQWVEGDPPSHWVRAVDESLAKNRQAISRLWKAGSADMPADKKVQAKSKAQQLVKGCLKDVLGELYPS